MSNSINLDLVNIICFDFHGGHIVVGGTDCLFGS